MLYLEATVPWTTYWMKSCCASLMEVSALNFFWKPLSMLKISVLLYKTAHERLRPSKSG